MSFEVSVVIVEHTITETSPPKTPLQLYEDLNQDGDGCCKCLSGEIRRFEQQLSFVVAVLNCCIGHLRRNWIREMILGAAVSCLPLLQPLQ